ncbi:MULTISPECIES: aspartate kinase [unclassified Moorena]|uniref:aspartate kinase n=1 Tax=unclassified Moorena TaxID=2683338 RepID=UPI0013BBC7DC|nr:MULTISPECIES: aspartate kinase [unclassified Moorena]NEQ10248.1 aspartate kinase [Moorena sp. SIO4E2]NEQ15641.1 aspartate kinase [Moorena sp. SIO3E2]NES44004.1 aspartate kinase [Moorena sp. SIO2C4]
MALVVQKYGGTSVGSVERIQAVAQGILKTVQQDNSVVVVVSAMGKTTDGLVQLAKAISPNPCRREMDMLLSTGEQVSIALLSMALQELGQPAISLTGAQVGIVTETKHSSARIMQIETQRLERCLNEGKVVVVAGFQGITSTDELEITTLGRGGSDTSAVALAAALGASRCEIYTDVPGILTTDPRIVPDAQLMPEITADEMLELASLGAKVLHPRAVEIARNYGLTLVVLSSWSDQPGTKVISPSSPPRSLEGLEIARPVNTVEYDTDQAKVALLRVPDSPGVAARLFGEIAVQDLDVDLIIQSIHEQNTNDIAFTVNSAIINRAEAVAEAIAPALRRQTTPDTQEAEVMVGRDIAKVSITGAGMIGRPGVAAQMFRALADAGVNIEMISTSEIKVSCVIDAVECDRAIAALCNCFDINNTPIHLPIPPEAGNSDHSREITHPPVRGVALDINQARLAIRQIPDRPGMAAKIFGTLAEHNISIDMIIQSQRCRIINGIATRDLAFTVPQAEAEMAQKALQQMAPVIGCSEILLDADIAKVSIVGAGMVGQPGIAAQMFAALGSEQINIQMIATSEIKISCVVAQDQGVRALQAIHKAFGLAGSQKIEVPA